ncbi:hypothetical protein GCM10010924_48180 [Rhizobium wenxiniae]|nr:hypothetical protein GCM10010924_48180 [Rhizobium wenxiniae]
MRSMVLQMAPIIWHIPDFPSGLRLPNSTIHLVALSYPPRKSAHWAPLDPMLKRRHSNEGTLLAR